MKKVINNKSELELSELVGFNGKYVESLQIRVEKDFGFEGSVKNQLSQLKKLRKEQLKKKAKTFGMNPTEFLKLQEKAELILNYFETGHSMGCYRVLQLKFKGKILKFASNDKLFTYSNSCRYSPTYGQVAITLTKKELQEIEVLSDRWTLTNQKGIFTLQERGLKSSYFVELKKA